MQAVDYQHRLPNKRSGPRRHFPQIRQLCHVHLAHILPRAVIHRQRDLFPRIAHVPQLQMGDAQPEPEQPLVGSFQRR